MITRFLFDKEEYEYPTKSPLTSTIESLDSQVTTNPAAVEGLVGSVSKDDVFLYHSNGNRRNSFVPTFYGYFVEQDSGTVLKGEITLNRLVKKFMLIWIAIVALASVATLFSLITNPAASWISLAYILVVLAVAIGFLLYLKNNASPAKELLKQRISSAINAQLS